MLVVQLSLLAFAVNLAAPAASYATVEIAYMGNEMARSYVEPCLAHTATATDSLYRFCRPRFRTTLLELPMLMVLESAHIGFLLGDVFYQSCMPEYVRDRREHVYAANARTPLPLGRLALPVGGQVVWLYAHAAPDARRAAAHQE